MDKSMLIAPFGPAELRDSHSHCTTHHYFSMDRYEGGDDVKMGTRRNLPLLSLAPATRGDIFKRFGIALSTRGNRLSRNAVVVVKDYYRLHGGKLIQRNKQQGTNPDAWYGEVGPAEASGAIRIGDIVYAINGKLTINKSKRQINNIVKSIVDSGEAPLIIVWKYAEGVNQIPWELEVPMPPPEGVYWQPHKEWGVVRPTEQTSSVTV